MFFGDVGVCWALLGATCCAKGFYMAQCSIYAVFAVSGRHARKVRTGKVDGKCCGWGAVTTIKQIAESRETKITKLTKITKAKYQEADS